MLKKASYHAGFATGIVAAFLLAGAVVAGSAGLDDWLAPPDARWAGWIVKQKQGMIRQPGSSRLIVVAGSNGLFGISAADLGKATGRRVINAATHASLGYGFYDVNLLDLPRPGDIVLMPLENGMYTRDIELTSFLVQTAHQVGLRYFLGLSLRRKIEYVRLLRSDFILDQYRLFLFPKEAGDIYGSVSRQGYWRLGLSGDGDVDLTLAAPRPDRVQAQVASYAATLVADESGAAARESLCGSIRRTVRRGVRVVGTPNNMYADASGAAARHDLMVKASALFRRCGGEWLDVPNEGLQPLDRMLDTPFHLNAPGRRRRTEELASALCRTIVQCPGQPAEQEEPEASR